MTRRMVPQPQPREKVDDTEHAGTTPLSTAQAAREALASRLDGLRRDAELTGHELAVRCGWHKSKASRIARARTAPRTPTSGRGAKRVERGIRRPT